MRARELAKKILTDLYKGLDEYSKDIIRGDLAEIKFKGFYIKGKEGEKVYIRSLEDLDDLKDFEVEDRSYKLKNVNLEKLDFGLMIITLSSRKSSKYKFDSSNYSIVYPSKDITVNFRERILKWMDKDEDELDEEIIEFDDRIDKILRDILKKNKVGKNITVHLDVLVDTEKLENFVEKDKDNVIIWIHPAFIFSDDEVLRGLLAYELSKINKNIIEKEYKSIIKYCREYKILTNKNLKILEKIREIANKKKDEDSLKEIDEIIKERF
ncbi:hypothetical protein [Methanocaldococcus sp.]